MQDYNLPQSKSIPNCFTSTEKEALSAAVSKLTSMAVAANTTELRNFPATYSNYLNSHIGEVSMNCMYSSRDFMLYFTHFDVSKETLSDTFTKFIDKKYLTVHNYFSELINLLQVQQYDDYGKKLNNMLRTIFGNKTVKEDPWSKTVTNL